MASTYLRSAETNAHPLSIGSANDLKRHLGEIDMSEEEIEKISDMFLYCTVKLEGVDTRAANLMKTSIETLGGALAMRKDAHEFTVRETDVLISGSRHTLRLLATRLKGEPSAWTGLPRRSPPASPQVRASCRGGLERWISPARPTSWGS